MPTHQLSSLIARVVQDTRARIDAPDDFDDVTISHLTIDSREASSGTLFVALRGAQNDGHRFVHRAVEQGASAVLVDADRATEFASLSVPVLTTMHTRAVLGDVARIFYEDPFERLRAVIGITGTNGKTTSTYIAESLLEQAGLCVGVIGTINYRWGREVCIPARNTTPESIVLYELAHRMAEDGVDVLLMEVSSHGLETHRLNGIAVHAAVFTNLTQDHLDFHGSMQAYRAAKRKLFFEHLRADGHAILNLDEEVGRQWARELEAQGVDVRGFGLEASEQDPDEGVCWRASIERESFEGSDVVLAARASMRVPLLGAFNVSNVLGVMRAIEALGLMSLDELCAATPSISAVPGRMQRVSVKEDVTVFVDYAHTPDALEHALETLRDVMSDETSHQLWCVFGCGGDRDRGKRALMGEVASRMADRVLVTSDNPRSEPPMQIIEQILEGMSSRAEQVEVEPDRALAIRAAIVSAQPGDAILIAGKGHETYQELAMGRVDFDDVAYAREALAQRRRGGSC